MNSPSATECCPPFDPQPWNDQLISWENKAFIKASVRTFFYMPLNFGAIMKRLDKDVRNAGGTFQHNLCLSDHTSRWNMDIYLAVDQDIPGYENTSLNGLFYSRVYEGPFRDTGKWCKDFEIHAGNKGLVIKKWYMWYTVCPKCAKKYGKNHVVVICQVEENNSPEPQ